MKSTIKRHAKNHRHPDGVETFQMKWKISTWSEIFLDHMESFQSICNFPDGLETLRTIITITAVPIDNTNRFNFIFWCGHPHPQPQYDQKHLFWPFCCNLRSSYSPRVWHYLSKLSLWTFTQAILIILPPYCSYHDYGNIHLKDACACQIGWISRKIPNISSKPLLPLLLQKILSWIFQKKN